jgi:hypothetical protein
MRRYAIVLLCASPILGCTSTSRGPGLHERRVKSLGQYVQSLYASHPQDALADVQQVTYFATHGVTGPDLPFLGPTIDQRQLEPCNAKPPATLCLVVGLGDVQETNVACVCEALTYSYGDVSVNTYVLGWDERHKTWGILLARRRSPADSRSISHDAAR